jgi:hypothetical protein
MDPVDVGMGMYDDLDWVLLVVRRLQGDVEKVDEDIEYLSTLVNVDV